MRQFRGAAYQPSDVPGTGKVQHWRGNFPIRHKYESGGGAEIVRIRIAGHETVQERRPAFQFAGYAKVARRCVSTFRFTWNTKVASGATTFRFAMNTKADRGAALELSHSWRIGKL